MRKIHHARAIFDTPNGINPIAGEWLHNMVLLPKATYGALVWPSHNLTQKEIDIMRKINRIGMNMQTRAKRSTPTRKMEIIMNSTPLHIKAQSEAIKAWGRVKNTLIPDWNGITNHKKRCPLAHHAWLEDQFTSITGGGTLISKGTRRQELCKRVSNNRSSNLSLIHI